LLPPLLPLLLLLLLAMHHCKHRKPSQHEALRDVLTCNVYHHQWPHSI
jgi:hypothetical protein